jgi:hypothetical protein
MSEDEMSDLLSRIAALATKNSPKNGSKDVKGNSRTNRATRTKAKSEPHTPCSHCGSQRHSDLQCWGRIMCDNCKRTGHPTDRCYRNCTICRKSHDDGTCPWAEAVKELKNWYEPVQHAGMLPSKIEGQLSN